MNNESGIRPKGIIKQLLKERGILLLQFARDIGVSENLASRIVNGWKEPHAPEMRKKISDYLNTPEAEIFVNKTQGGNTL